jgi:CheY-like chemotaxis protein
MIEAFPAPAPSAVVQQRILFVDDDLEFLQMIDRLLRLWSNNRIEVLTAPSASAALSLLQSNPPDLIVIDVCMPVVDGLQLLSIVSRRYPGVPKVVLTSQPDQATRDACLNNGAELFLEKPGTSEGFESIFATIEELAKWKPESGFRGMLRSVGLTDVLQMECIARSSSILCVTSKDAGGSIYIREGSIIHAESGDLKGEPAFKSLIALVSGDFYSKPFADPPEESIQLPWETLLMDAAQSRDELLGSQPPSKEPALDQTEIVTPLQNARAALSPIEIDELLLCSEAGDVYHAWQCPNPELRINLLEFISRKARSVESTLPFGSFDRTEFLSSGARLIAQSGNGRAVVLRTSLTGVATPGSDWPSTRSRASLRNQALQWFDAQTELPGLFAAHLHFSDCPGPLHARTSQFNQNKIDSLRALASEGFQISKLQRFQAQLSRWVFEQMILECARWSDNTLLLLIFNRRALELNNALVAKRLAEFLALESA